MKRAASLYKIDDVLLRYTEEQLPGTNPDRKIMYKNSTQDIYRGRDKEKGLFLKIKMHINSIY